MSYSISQVCTATEMAQVEALLKKEGIQKDGNLDYTCAMYDEDYNPIATGSCFGSTLRCFAVDSAHQGEGLLNEIISHLISVQAERGNFQLFLYTKPESARFFGDLGFYEIARADNKVVFMENRRTGFSGYLKRLGRADAAKKTVSALVMNANPFTLGHQYLVEKAAAESDVLHLFIVSEDASLVPFSVRKKLVMEGTKHLSNIVYHDSGAYIISSATFPSYFLKDEENVVRSHARLDIAVFRRIAAQLGINRRYVGDEPTSLTTRLYNEVMSQELPAAGMECIIVPRKEQDGRAISASVVRQCIQQGDWDTLETLVPASTLSWLRSKEACSVIERIRNSGNVVHH